MMGHGYYGKGLSDQHRYIKKFAWFPVWSGSSKRIWLQDYYIRHTFYDDNGKPPIKTYSWKYTYTKNEYLVEMLKNEI
jgi:hypothetical protein|tara:strand:- start:259 stop:492 length:234 start_codon:yes stop_codon:yes gene_type:complete